MGNSAAKGVDARMKIIWYGHSCVRPETGSSVILIDPFQNGDSTRTFRTLPGFWIQMRISSLPR
jgi:L-ascorbate metabolism protein UlaG (beta-lactamase superfamily)